MKIKTKKPKKLRTKSRMNITTDDYDFDLDHSWGKHLLTMNNAKTIKGEKLGYLTGILYLAPATESLPFGGRNVCPWKSKGCTASCLYTAGRGRFSMTKCARIHKTLLYFRNRASFTSDLKQSVKYIKEKALRDGMTPAFRLNGTSDIAWEKKNGIVDSNADCQFYDYTKGYKRMLRYLEGKMPSNYHLTFSKTETNWEQCLDILEKGGNVAVVFDTKKGKELPERYLGYKIVDADQHDLRFIDDEAREGNKGLIIGLRAKGEAKKDKSDFVVRA